MPQTLSLYTDPDRARATRRRRSTLPSMPWVELMGFLVMIALLVTTGG